MSKPSANKRPRFTPEDIQTIVRAVKDNITEAVYEVFMKNRLDIVENVKRDLNSFYVDMIHRIVEKKLGERKTDGEVSVLPGVRDDPDADQVQIEV